MLGVGGQAYNGSSAGRKKEKRRAFVARAPSELSKITRSPPLAIGWNNDLPEIL
jgi:hypothetical protein